MNIYKYEIVVPFFICYKLKKFENKVYLSFPNLQPSPIKFVADSTSQALPKCSNYLNLGIIFTISSCGNIFTISSCKVPLASFLGLVKSSYLSINQLRNFLQGSYVALSERDFTIKLTKEEIVARQKVFRMIRSQ